MSKPFKPPDTTLHLGNSSSWQLRIRSAFFSASLYKLRIKDSDIFLRLKMASVVRIWHESIN
ncbi:hypothetical protein BpHYR1_052301 [Brachionus plicatilis]|uniref:Uncharacterized protein n=1 Tax=Brachionus plicatilis TaxID=10195 RepID=A0A3M7QTB4_BRAPC|nr:hypothetical protein BpHYR1_052301 [Brachionus plicatilis]